MKVVKSYFLQIFAAYIMVCIGFIHAAAEQRLLQSRMPLAISLQEYCPSPISMRTRVQHYDFQSSSQVEADSSCGSTSSASVVCAQAISASPKTIKENQKTDAVYCKFCFDTHASMSHVYVLDATVVQELEVLFGIAKLEHSGSGEKGQPFVYRFEQSQSLEYAAAIVAGELLEKENEQITIKEIQKILDQPEIESLRVMSEDVCSYIVFCFFIEQALSPELKNCALLYRSISSCLMRVYLEYFDADVQPLAEQIASLEKVVAANENDFSLRLKNQDHSLNRVKGQTFMTYIYGLLLQALRDPKQIKGILNQRKANLLLSKIAPEDSIKSVQSIDSRQGSSPKSSGSNSANGSLRSIGIDSPCISPRVLALGYANEEGVGESSQADYCQLVLPPPLQGSGLQPSQMDEVEEIASLGQACCLKRFCKKYPKLTACLATLLTAGVGCGTYYVYAYTTWFHR